MKVHRRSSLFREAEDASYTPPMPSVHPTAIIEGEVELADDCVVGPNCVLRGPLRMGAGSRLIGNVYLHGPLEIGERNLFYPFACIGFAPQHARCDPTTSGPGTAIGVDNTFRESVTLHRAFTDEGPTRVGDHNFVMANGHIGHDSIVGNHCVITQNAMLGGHCLVESNVIIGGNTGMHQFTRAGRGAMLAGGTSTTADIPPWFMLTGASVCGSVNIVGMRRSGMSSEQIDTVRWVYRTLYRSGYTLARAIVDLKTRHDDPLVSEYIAFVESSKRGLCAGRPRPDRAGR